MKNQTQRFSLRERYRTFVSLVIIPLGIIIVVRAAMFGIQAWSLMLLGLVFIGLGFVRLLIYRQSTPGNKRK
jgi:uncharacterized membrane protein YecN with MAPEG domain